MQPNDSRLPFFGRDDAFAFIRQQLVAGKRPHAPVLLAERGMGKSALLSELPYRLEARYVVALVDCATLELTNFDEVIAALVAAGCAAIRTAEPDLISPEIPPDLTDADALWTWFEQTYLDSAFTVLRRFQRLVFCFDNASVWLDALDHGLLPAETPLYLSQLLAYEERISLILPLIAMTKRALSHTRFGMSRCCAFA